MKEYDATTGKPLTDDRETKTFDEPGTLVSGSLEFHILPLAEIVPSLTNRKTFDAAKLAELAASIKASGVHQPILVRPLPGERVPETDRKVKFEIVTGERRWRASSQAGVEIIPCMIRDLTDKQALEVQIIENLQREDLTALEEAEGFERLMATGLSAEEIGDKIGKSKRYVQTRIQLLDLCPEARNALETGKIDPSRALLIARIPDPTLQIKTTKEFCRTDGEGQNALSLRACQQWVRLNVMLVLKDAHFGMGDAALVPSAGACTDCPKRTGANPDLFADVDGPDMCTDPNCFASKQEAQSQRAVAEARNKGMTVIEGKEALELKPHKFANSIDGFTDLDSKLDLGDGPKPLRDQIDAKALKGKVTLFVDPHTGGHRHLVPDDLVEQLEQKSMSPADKKAAKKRAEKAAKELQANTAMVLERAYHERWRKVAIEQIEPRVRAGEVSQFAAPVLRSLLVALCEISTGDSDGIDIMDLAWALNKLDSDGALIEENVHLADVVTVTPDADLGPTLLLALLFTEATPHTVWVDGATQLVTQTPIIDSLADSLGLNLDAIRAQVQDQIRAESKPADVPVARPAKGAGGRKAKLSATEAQAGIANAMQGMEVPAANAVAWPAADADPLFPRAVDLIKREQKASVRLFKAELGIGTAKALELMSSLEITGKVSGCDERGVRKVLVTA